MANASNTTARALTADVANESAQVKTGVGQEQDGDADDTAGVSAGSAAQQRIHLPCPQNMRAAPQSCLAMSDQLRHLYRGGRVALASFDAINLSAAARS